MRLFPISSRKDVAGSDLSARAWIRGCSGGFDGYRLAMKDAALFDPRLVVTTPVPTSVTLGGTLFADLLAQAPDIDAVFCANDDLALGVLVRMPAPAYRGSRTDGDRRLQ